MEDCKAKKKILIEGMQCSKSINPIKESLCKIIGVSRVNVDIDGKYAILDTNIDVRDHAIKFVINKIGYKVTGIISM